MTTAIIITILLILATVFYFLNKGKLKPLKPTIKYYLPYKPNPIDFEIHSLINLYRMDKGLNIVKIESRICDVAGSHSVYMAKKKTPSHDYATERQNQFPDKLVGEIVAFNFKSAESVVNGWKSSPEHNAVLLSDKYSYIGIATAYDDKNKAYFTVIFTS